MSIFSALPSSPRLRPYLAALCVGVAALTVIGASGSHGLLTTAHAQPVCGTVWDEVEVCIELTPQTDSNPVGTPHTVTAMVTEDGGVPTVPWLVAFTITGANAGTMGSCSPNADCSVDASGQVDLTYAPIDHALGTDIITGCILEPVINGPTLHLGAQVPTPTLICDDVTKDWFVPTPTPSPTPTATPTATPTPSPTPEATEAAAPAGELPATGGAPSDGSGSVMPWLAAVTGAMAVVTAGAFWLAYQRRIR